jgi:hypothetical protein
VSRRSYVTRRTVARVEGLLSVRDRAIVSDVARLNVLSGQQIMRMRYAETESGKRMARLDLARLTQLRLLARLDRVIGGRRAGSEGFVYALDVAGQRIAYPQRRRYRPPWTPQPNHLRHAIAVSDLYVRIHEADNASGVRLMRFDAEPACWRHFHGPGGARMVLKPDAFVIMAGQRYEDRWFVEVDRDTEPTTRILVKAKQYLRYWQSGREQERTGAFPGVLWVVPNGRRRDQIADVVAGLNADGPAMFSVATNDEAIDVLSDADPAPSIGSTT